MSYTIEIDREACIACGVCYNTDPTHYTSDDERKSKVVGGASNGKSLGDFNDGLKDDSERAAVSCPVSAITVT
jgi:ferredoxin